LLLKEKRFLIWDFSRSNERVLKDKYGVGSDRLAFLPYGFTPQLDAAAPAFANLDDDVDVAFFGLMNAVGVTSCISLIFC
jgi:hypothetical protein